MYKDGASPFGACATMPTASQTDRVQIPVLGHPVSHVIQQHSLRMVDLRQFITESCVAGWFSKHFLDVVVINRRHQHVPKTQRPCVAACLALRLMQCSHKTANIVSMLSLDKRQNAGRLLNTRFVVNANVTMVIE